eukprot:773562_1
MSEFQQIPVRRQGPNLDETGEPDWIDSMLADLGVDGGNVNTDVELPQQNGGFVDQDFPPCQESAFHGETPMRKIPLDWRRAEAVHGASPGDSIFAPYGIDPMDIKQGVIGDCWFLASIACVA